MRHSPRHTMLTMALAPALILAGCASPMPPQAVAPKAVAPTEYQLMQMQNAKSRKQRERVMQSAWRGQSYQSLLEKFGPPQAVMSHPGMRAGRGEIVLYGMRDASTNCLDAFTVILPGGSPERIVGDYFCR